MTKFDLHPGERAAREARRSWGMPATGPAADLLTTCEQVVGIPVLLEQFESSEVAGVLLRSRAHGDFIAVNADAHATRQRFTLAHELGHVHLGHEGRVDLRRDVVGNPRDPQEIEANYFAAELLAPRIAVREWLEDMGAVRHANDPAVVTRLALSFGIALSAACFRLERTDLITTTEKKRLLETLRGRGDLIRRYSADRLNDQIERLHRDRSYPRVPQATLTYARQALEDELIDTDEYTAITRREMPDMDVAGWFE